LLALFYQGLTQIKNGSLVFINIILQAVLLILKFLNLFLILNDSLFNFLIVLL